MGDAPFIIIKNRPGLSHKRSVKIDRFWKHKETGNVVEVRKLQNVVPDNYLRVVFYDPLIKHELAMPMYPRPNPFQPPNAAETLMEQGFLEAYEIYGDQRSTRV